MSKLACLVIYVFYLISSIKDVESSILSCSSNDVACLEKNANAVYQMIMKGVPERHIEPQEPLFLEFIEGDLSILKYKFYNSTFAGIENCKINNLSWDAKSSTARFDYDCKAIKAQGQYEISGRLIILPVEGKGDYGIQITTYKLQVECGMNMVEKADGTKHWHINTYKLQATATGPLVFDFKNLFNGQKDLSDTIHKFANTSWKEVADLVQDPVWYAALKKIVSAANKFLKNENV